jgi:patatin-like phospholipase/acyl hydrolase
MAFRILSLDGGGIRGIIPAILLADLERRTGKRTAELFDMVAGTSTGGILALGLVRPGADGEPMYRAEDMVNLYVEDGPRIFERRVWHRIKAIGNLAEEKYPNQGVDEVLEGRLGDARLADAVLPVLVTAYDLEAREPHFFKSHRAQKDPTKNFLMRDAARATSAAPTYFEPAHIRAWDDQPYAALVDGGVYANNPSACALVEAICDFGQHPDNVVLLSLGTGEHTRSIPYDEAKGWGLAKWAQPILNVVFDGVCDTVDYQVRSILKPLAGLERYHRIQTELTHGNDEMDDASQTNLRMLRMVAEDLIRANDRKLDEWADRLTRTEGADAAKTTQAPDPLAPAAEGEAQQPMM